MTSPQKLATRFLHAEWERLSHTQRRVIQAITERRPVARDAVGELADARTFGERLADQLAEFGGSWRFILLFLGTMLIWAAVNTAVLGPRHDAFDPYPYVFLNLMLSMLAALQAPMILMSQSRQTMRDRTQASADYEVNLKSEVEIQRLHEKFDELREAQWQSLVALQDRQIVMLERLLAARGDGPPGERVGG